MKLAILSLTVLLTRLSFGATYGVPVPDNLKGSSVWDMPRATAVIKDNVLEVDYRLPVSLAEKTSPVLVFTGKVDGDFVPVKGEGVRGMCMVSRKKPLVCTLKYPDLVIDEDSRNAAIGRDFQADRLNRELVAQLFFSDPAGILTIEPVRK